MAIFQLVFKLTSTFTYFITIATCQSSRFRLAATSEPNLVPQTGCWQGRKNRFGIFQPALLFEHSGSQGKISFCFSHRFPLTARRSHFGIVLFMLFLPEAFFVHDKLSIIKAALRSRASSLSSRSSRSVPAVTSPYLRRLAGHQRARRQNKVVCSISAAWGLGVGWM